jgi:hypothetical protein
MAVRGILFAISKSTIIIGPTVVLVNTVQLPDWFNRPRITFFNQNYVPSKRQNYQVLFIFCHTSQTQLVTVLCDLEFRHKRSYDKLCLISEKELDLTFGKSTFIDLARRAAEPMGSGRVMREASVRTNSDSIEISIHFLGLFYLHVCRQSIP